MRPGTLNPGVPAQPAVAGNGRLPLVQTPLPTRERRPGYIALAVALIIGLAAVGAYLYTQAGAKTPVVIVVQSVPVGHQIQRSDLSTVSVAGDITAIAGSNLNSLVGKTATVTLLPHTLLQRAMVADAAQLPAGQVLVGVAVSPGQVPADGLDVGTKVQVVGLPAKNVAGAQPTILVPSATVAASTPNGAVQGGTLLTLQVAAAAAPQIAAASNANLIALIRTDGP
ncbi:MAG: SAF domain-containing protein [Actinomycetota bacterium]|nr:SAF domain-containing protein [Actinomycetota bacterium]MDQ2957639.1 SAF domain-containing protein [Actinomycetota bacterium]